MAKFKSTLMVLFTLLSILMGCFASPQTASAQSGTPWEVLAEINAYRGINNLDPLVENIYLNIAAQNHADWMAETGQYGHTGEGGSSYTDRALAAGYGQGKGIRVTENWARGYQMTANEVVYEMWKPSGIHNSQMLTTSYNEFGAGVALDGDGMTVYVVVFGFVTGGSLPVIPTQSTPLPSGPTSTPAPLILPIATATPNPDGSVVHIVQYGQALAAIADAYEMPLADLLAQNSLTEDSVIYPEQELLIKPATKQAATATKANPTLEEKEPTQQPSPSPTRTTHAGPTQTSNTPTETPAANGGWLTKLFMGNTLWVGVALVTVSLIGLGLFFYSSKKSD